MKRLIPLDKLMDERRNLVKTAVDEIYKTRDMVKIEALENCINIPERKSERSIEYADYIHMRKEGKVYTDIKEKFPRMNFRTLAAYEARFSRDYKK